MAKVTEIVLFTLIPISSAAPRSSDTQRMAFPVFVLEMNRVSAIMMMILAAMVISVSGLITSCPSNSRMVSIAKRLGKTFGFAPQISSAVFCSR